MMRSAFRVQPFLFGLSPSIFLVCENPASRIYQLLRPSILLTFKLAAFCLQLGPNFRDSGHFEVQTLNHEESAEGKRSQLQGGQIGERVLWQRFCPQWTLRVFDL